MELWLPTLGKHLTFGDKYDVSRAGNVAAQDAYLKAEFGDGYNADLVDDDGVPIYSKERAKINYANHWWTHLIIDLAGYKWQKL